MNLEFLDVEDPRKKLDALTHELIAMKDKVAAETRVFDQVTELIRQSQAFNDQVMESKKLLFGLLGDAIQAGIAQHFDDYYGTLEQELKKLEEAK